MLPQAYRDVRQRRPSHNAVGKGACLLPPRLVSIAWCRGNPRGGKTNEHEALYLLQVASDQEAAA